MKKTNNVDSSQMPEQFKQYAQEHWNLITPYAPRRIYHQMPQHFHVLRDICDNPTNY